MVETIAAGVVILLELAFGLAVLGAVLAGVIYGAVFFLRIVTWMLALMAIGVMWVVSLVLHK
jgi:hypothetical protein